MSDRSSMSSSIEYRSNRPTRPFIFAASVAIAAIVGSDCGGKKPDADTVAAAGPPAVTVVVTPVVQRTVPLFTELTARTDATESVDIRARVKAFLKEQSYLEGTMVEAGQVLFTLD